MKETVLAFIGRINAHDVEGLAALMSVDHTFIDALAMCQTCHDGMMAESLAQQMNSANRHASDR